MYSLQCGSHRGWLAGLTRGTLTRSPGPPRVVERVALRATSLPEVMSVVRVLLRKKRGRTLHTYKWHDPFYGFTLLLA